MRDCATTGKTLGLLRLGHWGGRGVRRGTQKITVIAEKKKKVGGGRFSREGGGKRLWGVGLRVLPLNAKLKQRGKVGEAMAPEGREREKTAKGAVLSCRGQGHKSGGPSQEREGKRTPLLRGEVGTRSGGLRFRAANRRELEAGVAIEGRGYTFKCTLKGAGKKRYVGEKSRLTEKNYPKKLRG